MIFGERLQELRKDKGLTQQDIAKKFNTTKQAISRWENNLSEPDFDTLLKLSTELNTTVAYLIGETDDPTRRPEQVNININEITMINDIDTAKRFLMDITGYTKIKDLPDEEIILTANVFLSYLKKVKD